MSSVGRATSRGSKSGKVEHTNATAKAQKTDTKTETVNKTMENSKAQEQMRIAQIIGDKEDPQLKEKIKQVMDATHRPEIEVVSALFDSDYDANRAVNMLIEGQNSGEWETSSKKKKNRQPSASSKSDSGAPRGVSSADVDGENWDDETPTKPVSQADTQRTRNQRGGGSGAPRMRGRGAQDNRGWRGRENKENERNLEESRGSGPSAGGDRDQRDSFRRGGAGGSNRGGRLSNGAGRGGGRGGSRGGPRSFSNRGGHDRGGAPFPRATSWNPEEDGTDAKSNNFPSPEDWDNEEYTGSLSDTKVFTPSNVGGDASGNDSMSTHTVSSGTDPSSQPGVNSTNLNYAQSAAGGGSLSAAQTQYLRQLPDNKLQSSNVPSGTMGSMNSNPGPLTNSNESKTATRGMTPSAPSSGITYNSYAASAASSGASAPAPSSYPSSYSAVSASVPSVSSAPETNFTPASSVNTFSTYQTGQAQPASYTATATSFSTVYGAHQDGATRAGQALPARTKTQRPRVPPPSKIPLDAVEMPGDGVMGALDVQFGALDFGTEAFEMEPQSSPKSAPSVQSQSQPSPLANKYQQVSAGGMDSVSAPASQASMDMDHFASAKAAVLTQNLKDTLLQGSQSQQTQSVSQSQSNDLKSQPSNFNQQSRGPGVGQSPLDSLVKNDQGSAAVSASAAGAAGSLSYSAPNPGYQSSYTSQKSVGSGYQPSTGYNQTSYAASQAVSGVSASASNTYPTSYPSNASNQGYQNVGVQSVYGGGSAGAATGGNTSGSVVGSTSGYTTSSNASVYQNSYGTTTASASSTNKLTSGLSGAKDIPQYDTTATSSSNLSGPMTSNSGAPGLSGPNASVNNSQSLGMQGATSLPNANNTSTKVTNSSAKNLVQNVPPGVAPIIAAGTQYMISQGGLQYFAQQPAVYGYEEQQILPLRIPHMPAGYYDISFQQAPTSLATGRDGSLANVPYSMSDARFARTDNASPVPSSLSQQNPTQAQHQPMMNAASFPPGYTYYYGGSVLPANYQYGTPAAMYPQVAPAANAHGNSNSTQYPKPGNYGSSYGSGYESLSASQDYSKGSGGYTGGHSGAQTGSKAGVGANAPSTGSSSTDIFNKTHVALSKVNSYDKGFHSGTPPPFNLAGNQNTGMAPSAGFPTPLYIPPPMPQHHSTTLMQHPVHQQMDMRNTSRRSESGNNSGQRSQSSTQSNKPGSKQVYSQNYWAN